MDEFSLVRLRSLLENIGDRERNIIRDAIMSHAVTSSLQSQIRSLKETLVEKDVIETTLDWESGLTQEIINDRNVSFIVRIRDNGGNSFYKKYLNNNNNINNNNTNNQTIINTKYNIIYYGNNTQIKFVKYILIYFKL